MADFPLNVPVFAGQGNNLMNSYQTIQQALRDASTPSGSLLICQCYEAFHTELTSMTSDELEQTRLFVSDFQTPNALLAISPKYCAGNPLISGIRLLLIQCLRYLAFVESSYSSTDGHTPFSHILESNSSHRIGVLGFSSGILSACVVGASRSTFSFITWAIEAFRLAFWIGVRCQIYLETCLQDRAISPNSTLPWSRVFVGSSQQEIEKAICAFRKKGGDRECSICLTAIIDDNCVTVSGYPDTLKAFSDEIGSGAAIYDTVVDVIYHSPAHERTREQVLADVTRRKIRFPDFTDLIVPIRSSFTGQPVHDGTGSSSLVESVIDMLLIQPVNWNKVVEELVNNNQRDISLRFVNVGPGTGLCHRLEKTFADGIVSILDLTIPVPESSQPNSPLQEPIAIIGMSVNMPRAKCPQELWKILENGLNTITEIPQHRFRVDDYADPTYAKSGRSMKARTGNFIEGIDEFDHEFFDLSPREARNMDPQQRILLQAAYEALESCGYVPNSTPSFQQATFGCYIGAATQDYSQNLSNEIDVYYSTGNLRAFLSGRISYALQLCGPSVVIDTACSSSSVAIYQGCRALMNRDCNAALVGGVNAITSPDMFMGLDRSHLLSPTGQCKTFDAKADGYARSEGCGVLVLKRLSDAQSDNDHILGVIRGAEVNQSGPAISITRPHFPTQAMLFRHILDRSGIDPARVNVVEAHGTGTTIGDSIEVASIRSVFGQDRKATNPLYITSIKGNIGHLEAASGVAGLAKLVLMLEHHMIPKQISLQDLNPNIPDLELDHTVIPTEHATWTTCREGVPRMALLNSFGIAGSNTAILVEEYITSHPAVFDRNSTALIFGLSAKSEDALEELRLRYLRWLRTPEGESVHLADIAYTMTARRQIYPYRLGVSASDRDSLHDKLSRTTVTHITTGAAKVVFVFSGQGSEYVGMGRALYQTSPLFRLHINTCHSILVAFGFPGVLQIISADIDENMSSPQAQFEEYQVAIISLQYALAQLWISWGLNPTAVIGHSLGEYAALVIANVLALEDALKLVAIRSRLIAMHCAQNSTGMIAVNAPPGSVESELNSSGLYAGLEIACFNSPVDCVVSGPLKQLHAFKRHLDLGVCWKSVILSLPFGFHSAAMKPMLSHLRLAAQNVSFRPPTIHIASTVVGDVVMPGNDSVFDADYIVRHSLEPVLFDVGVRSLSAHESIGAWIEIGPHTSCLRMLKSCLVEPADEPLLLASLRKRQYPWATLMSSLSRLYLSHLCIRWRDVFAHLSPNCSSKLPSYPFAQTKFWVAYKEDVPRSIPTISPPSANLITEFSILHSWFQYPSSSNGNVAIFETPISCLSTSIQGHMVGNVALCPVSVYLELIFAGIDLAGRHSGTPYRDCNTVIREIEIVQPLVYREGVACTLKTAISLGDGCGNFHITCLLLSSAEETILVSGAFTLRRASEIESKFSNAYPVLCRRIDAAVKSKDGGPPEVFSTRTTYDVIFPRVVEYAKMYHTIQTITIDASGMEGYAIVSLPRDHDRGKYVIHPVFMDTLIHVAGFVANLRGGNDVYICSEIASVKIIPDLVDRDATYGVFCSNAWLEAEGVMLAEAYAIQMAAPEKIIAHIKGMHFRRVRYDSLKRTLSLAIGRLTPESPGSPNSRGPGFQAKNARHAAPNSDGLLDEVQMEVRRAVSESCNIDSDSINSNTSLISLGIDSQLATRIYQTLQTSFPDAIRTPRILSSFQSLGDIAKEIVFSCSSSPMRSHGSSDNSSPRTPFDSEELRVQNIPHIDGPDVGHILASILYINPHDLDEDTDLRALGLDSLTSIEAQHTLKSEFGVDLPQNFFYHYPTVRSIQSYLSCACLTDQGGQKFTPPGPTKSERSATSVTKLPSQSLPVLVQKFENPLHLPLFLFHDGSGLVRCYDSLSPLGRRVWAIPNPDFGGSNSWDCLPSMAASYAQRVIQTSSDCVILGGWSFGGVVAFEVARHLTTSGIHVKGVLLIDSPCPLEHAPLPDALFDYVINMEGNRGTTSQIGKLVKAQCQMSSRILGQYNPRSTRGSSPPLALLRSSEGFNPPDVSDVPTWLADRDDPKQVVAAWEKLVGATVKVWTIPGHHFQVFNASNIAEVSRCMDEACRYLEEL